MWGDHYFLIGKQSLSRFYNLFIRCTNRHRMQISTDKLPIAYLELLAALIGIVCFSPLCQYRLVRLNCDNTDAVAWLNKSRCSAGIGFRILSAVELYKHKFCLKVSTQHIPGIANNSADSCHGVLIPLAKKDRERTLR